MALTYRTAKMELVSLLDLRKLIEVYEEVAATRMQKVRSAVLTSRQYLDGLLGVFTQVKAVYGKSTINRNGRSVAVFISANSGLYGSIVEKVFDLFLEFISQNKSNIVIVGKWGLKMIRDRRPDLLYNYYDLSDQEVELETLGIIMRYLLQFEKIFVFHGKFRTIVAQDPVATPVSGDSITKLNTGSNVVVGKTDYLFEPELPEIVSVFEGEILASIFEQSLHEAQLAKFASRIFSLDKSMESIEDRFAKVSYTARRLKRNLNNRKQLGRVAGMSLWN